MARVVVIGDVGGHVVELRRALSAVGVRSGDEPALPADVTVVQVGDLVDRGPDSHAVLELVSWYLDHQPDQWIQLTGNHEAQYLPGNSVFWSDRLDAADADLLRSWWADGRLRIAAAVRRAGSDDLLLTHAGLTVECWRELGDPATAAGSARLLNERPEPLIWRGDVFGIDTGAGPLWAEAGWELHEPWMRYHAEGGYVPFGQAHGHSSIVRFVDRTWRCPGRVRQRASVDWEARHVRVRIGGRTFVGVDPKHGRTGAPQWAPLILDGAEVLAGRELTIR